MKNEMRLQQQQPSDDEVDDVAIEIANYLSHKNFSTDDNTLLYWKNSTKDYPILAQLAELYLVMSASFVPVESMFLITGLIINSKRCMMGEEKLHRVSFINDNYKFV